MHDFSSESGLLDWDDVLMAARGLLSDETDYIANTANLSSLLYTFLNESYENTVNWVGFYFLRDANQLVLGPFQGKVACVRIQVGRGVCGTAVSSKTTIVVDDVHEFPGHIACDSASESEIVVPLLSPGESSCYGVLDIDSRVKSRWSDADRVGCEKLCEMLVQSCDWSPLAKNSSSL